MLTLLGLSLTLAVTGPCDLLSREAASALLGAPVTKTDPAGPERDEDTGGMRTICAYEAGTRMLIVTRESFANAAAAKAATTQELVSEHLDDESATLKDEPGLGDKAYWAVTRNGAEYIVVKGASVLGIALGGMPKPAASYQAQLRATTVAVMGKL